MPTTSKQNSFLANPLGLTTLFFNIKYLLFVASDSIGIDFSYKIFTFIEINYLVLK